MEIINYKTGKIERAAVWIAQPADIRKLIKKRYFFNWASQSKTSIIYVISVEGQEDILGAVSILLIPAEFRIEIIILGLSKENVGSKKIYEGLAGCLLAYVCRLSIFYYGDKACVSLIPKTVLRSHYMKLYGMENAGKQVYLDGINLLNLIKKYLK